MSIGSEAYKRLQQMKFQELSDYYTMHRDIIQPFLDLRKEYNDLGTKGTYALLNACDELMKTRKPKQWTKAELDGQLRQMEAIAGKDKRKK